MPYTPNQPITITFYHGTADLADGDWDEQKVFCDGVEKSTVLTVIQVTDNYYKATFTPTAAATWDIHLNENSEFHHFTFHVKKEETLQLIRAAVARIDENIRRYLAT